jgi:hypothetical protein
VVKGKEEYEKQYNPVEMTKTVSLRKPGKVKSRYRVYWERKSGFPPIFSTLLATGVVCSFWIYGLADDETPGLTATYALQSFLDDRCHPS